LARLCASDDVVLDFDEKVKALRKRGTMMKWLPTIAFTGLLELMALGLCASAEAGSITSASSSDPAHTTLLIDTSLTAYALPVVVFTIDFTTLNPVTISVGVDGAGSYELVAAMANVTNGTSTDWTTFTIDLAQAPAGTYFYGVGFNSSSSPNQFQTAAFYPDASTPTGIYLSGGTGVGPGQIASLEPGVTTTGAGVFDVRFTPNGSFSGIVPEPSGIVLSSAAIVCMFLWRCARRVDPRNHSRPRLAKGSR
jgi:hypothetical protein